MVTVAHPYGLAAVKTCGKHRARLEVYVCFAVFTLGCTLYFAALLMCHQLHAVANPENRQAQLVYSRIYMRSILSIYTAWTAGENNPLR
ncbi:hypothetical protein D3C80_1978600 [compost metagenome]